MPALDRAALSDAFVEHGPRLLRYLSRTLSPSDAEDVLSETFCVAWTRRDHYRPDAGPLVGWLFGIATNLLRQHKRSFLRGATALAKVPAAGTDAEDMSDVVADRVDAVAARGALTEALANLNDDQREVLLLSCWGQLEHAEIALALDIPVATVRTRLFRARRHLLERRASFLTTTQGAVHV